MEQNTDEYHIHMARNMFDRLVAIAEGGSTNENDRREIRRVLYHVRKYNPVFKEEQRIDREEKQAFWKACRNKVIACFKAFHTRPAYVLASGDHYKITYIQRNSDKLALSVGILDWKNYRLKTGVVRYNQLDSIVAETQEIKDKLHALAMRPGECRRFFEAHESKEIKK